MDFSERGKGVDWIYLVWIGSTSGLLWTLWTLGFHNGRKFLDQL